MASCLLRLIKITKKYAYSIVLILYYSTCIFMLLKAIPVDNCIDEDISLEIK